MIAHSYHELYDVPFTILHYGIPFGPQMREALVIPKFLQLALDGRTITVNGDGSQYRNYIYVEDLADGHARCLHQAATNQVINLEGPAPISIRDIIEAIQRILNRDVAVEHLPSRPGDFRGRTVSAAKAAQLLDWHPTTSFYDGLQWLHRLVPRRASGQPAPDPISPLIASQTRRSTRRSVVVPHSR